MIFNDDCIPEPVSANVGQCSAKGIDAYVNAGYGLSVHWGLYSLEGRIEWVYFTERIPEATYRQRMGRFNPERFDAEEWGDLMLEAGQKFLMITSKHHDGFCLWDTPLTDFKVTNTAFKRDILAELAPALRDRGIALHFYYSLVDWTHPAYRNDWPAYVAYYQAQVRDLCTRFGPIGGILFDGYWPRIGLTDDEITYHSARGKWDFEGTYQMIHSLQPDAVLTNNNHILPGNGEDVQVWELDLPGENTLGFNTNAMGKTVQSCWWNINTGWSYAPASHSVKSTASLLDVHNKVREKNGVFMLNVGPRSWGDIHPDEQRVLREIGQALRAEAK